MFTTSLSLLAALVALSESAPLAQSYSFTFSNLHPQKNQSGQSSIAGPVIAGDFPDPAVIPYGGGYHAFSTSSGGMHVPSAKAVRDLEWAVDHIDALPNPGAWSTGNDIWAPDVVQLRNGTFLMYYSAPPISNPGFHCIGTATSKTIDGPYKAADQPLVCHIEQGGAIDASGYRDPATGFRYVVYKIDGNHNGHGGDCNNGVEPIVSTPIKLQQVRSDGVSRIGEAVTILDRDDSDGPLVEAPSIFRSEEGIYFLIFSSGCFTSPNYNVKYATATSIAGPYTKARAPLIRSGDGPNLNGPGGATISSDGKLLVFHANLNPPGEPLKRGMFTARPKFSGMTVTI